MHDCLGCDKDTTITEYASHPTIQGMYAKMLTGMPRNAHVSLEKLDIDLAIKRLGMFEFVGLTEFWDLSVCLMHFHFRGKLPPVFSEYGNFRPMAATSGKNSPKLSKKIFGSAKAPPLHDESQVLESLAAMATFDWVDQIICEYLNNFFNGSTRNLALFKRAYLLIFY